MNYYQLELGEEEEICIDLFVDFLFIKLFDFIELLASFKLTSTE